jgi:hypothetical protein
MSSSEIQALCELYIGRKFDEDDCNALREFLRDLQTQKPKKPKEEHKEKTPTGVVAFVPISERKQHLAREVAPGERPPPVSLADLGANVAVADRKAQWVNKTEASAGDISPRAHAPVVLDATSPRAKDRLQSYEKNIQGGAAGAHADLVAERLAEAQGGGGVKDRLGAWASGQVQGSSGETKEQVAAGRLEEIKGAQGVKDRQAAYTSTVGNTLPSKKELVDERLAEVKGAPGVKDRLGNWAGQADSHATNAAAVEERIADVKGVAGVKDRLGQWNQVTAAAEKIPTSDPTKVEERLADLGTTGVKDRVGGWTNRTEPIIASTVDPTLAASRTAELAKAQSVKDRTNVYKNVATDDKPVVKAPIYIPQDVSELPTKETQGQ